MIKKKNTLATFLTMTVAAAIMAASILAVPAIRVSGAETNSDNDSSALTEEYTLENIRN